MLGCSPFIGAGQFGFKALIYYQRFSLNPENMVKLFLRSFELGVKAVQLLGVKPIDALIKAAEISGVKPFVIYSTDRSGFKLKRVLERLKPLEVEFVAVHAEVADRRDIDRVMERLRIVREYGVSGAIATHRPGLTIPWVERENLPVDVVLTPLNSVGYAMDPDFTSSIKAIRMCSRRVVAIKPLAAGRLRPTEAFRFVYRYADSAAVGVATEEEMGETYEAALREYEKVHRFKTE
jgi:hypothetical protein